jgi:hypothetical protein
VPHAVIAKTFWTSMTDIMDANQDDTVDSGELQQYLEVPPPITDTVPGSLARLAFWFHLPAHAVLLLRRRASDRTFA